MNYQRGIKYIWICIIMITIGCEPETESTNSPLSGHVVVIGIDALSPDGVQSSDTPYMDELMARGAYTMQARAVMPTSSSPNWASMIMGAGPEQHGVTSNAWEPDDYELSPTTKGPGGIFPTIFYVLKDQKPDMKTASVYDWPGFGRLFEKEYVDFEYMPDIPRETTEDRILWAEYTMQNAVEYMIQEKPEFMFIQLDHVDHIGHRIGHGTDEFYYYTAHADSLIGEMINALEMNDMLQNTTIIINSDHGGIEFGHGGATDIETFIPFIIAGPETKEDYDLESYVNTYDMAPTIAYIFGVEQPEAWIGQPLKQAFK